MDPVLARYALVCTPTWAPWIVPRLVERMPTLPLSRAPTPAVERIVPLLVSVLPKISTPVPATVSVPSLTTLACELLIPPPADTIVPLLTIREYPNPPLIA